MNFFFLFLLISSLFVFILIFFKIYIKLTTGWCYSSVCLIGKTAIITGSDKGLGFETALDFAKRGARVILACRNKIKGDKAVKQIKEKTRNDNIVLRMIDLASLESVRQFAKKINATEPRLDILVNNAGITTQQPKHTVDGFWDIIQVNYLAPFLLTYLLQNLLINSGPSRIVNIASIGAIFSNLDIDKVLEKPSKSHFYYNSKLCNILFTKELARQLENTGVTTYSLHPGIINTSIVNSAPLWIKLPSKSFLKFIWKNEREGAQTQIHVSVARNIEKNSGEHFEDCHPVPTYKTASNPDHPKQLWKKTMEILNLNNNES